MGNKKGKTSSKAIPVKPQTKQKAVIAAKAKTAKPVAVAKPVIKAAPKAIRSDMDSDLPALPKLPSLSDDFSPGKHESFESMFKSDTQSTSEDFESTTIPSIAKPQVEVPVENQKKSFFGNFFNKKPLGSDAPAQMPPVPDAPPIDMQLAAKEQAPEKEDPVRKSKPIKPLPEMPALPDMPEPVSFDEPIQVQPKPEKKSFFGSLFHKKEQAKVEETPTEELAQPQPAEEHADPHARAAQQLDTLHRRLDSELREKQKNVSEQQSKVDAREKELEAWNEALQKKEQDMAYKEKEYATIKKLQAQLEDKEITLNYQKEELDRLKADLEQKEIELQEKEEELKKMQVIAENAPPVPTPAVIHSEDTSRIKEKYAAAPKPKKPTKKQVEETHSKSAIRSKLQKAYSLLESRNMDALKKEYESICAAYAKISKTYGQDAQLHEDILELYKDISMAMQQ